MSEKMYATVSVLESIWEKPEGRAKVEKEILETLELEGRKVVGTLLQQPDSLCFKCLVKGSHRHLVFFADVVEKQVAAV